MLDKLPETQKQLVMRIYSADKPINAIAQQIGKSPAALYQMLTRVRRSLLSCVERTLSLEGVS